MFGCLVIIRCCSCSTSTRWWWIHSQWKPCDHGIFGRKVPWISEMWAASVSWVKEVWEFLYYQSVHGWSITTSTSPQSREMFDLFKGFPGWYSFSETFSRFFLILLSNLVLYFSIVHFFPSNSFVRMIHCWKNRRWTPPRKNASAATHRNSDAR